MQEEKSNPKIFKIMLMIGIIPFMLDLLYSMYTIATKGYFEIFMDRIYGIQGFLTELFTIILFGFIIFVPSLILIIISSWRLFPKGRYYIILGIGILLFLIIGVNGGFGLKSLLYSIKDLWVVAIIGLLLIIFSSIKLIEISRK